jgi:hypothetical protein
MDDAELPPESAAADVATSADAASSVQIAAVADADADSPTDYIELGDTLIVKRKDIGILIGTVYYRDARLLQLKLNNGSNVLMEFEMDGGDFSDEELEQIIGWKVRRKRVSPAFVEQHNIQAGQRMITYDPAGRVIKDGETGEPYYYIIKTVNPNADTITYEDKEGKVYPLEFSFIGIKSEEDFRVIETSTIPDGELGAGVFASAAADAAAAADEQPSIQEQVEAEEAAESAAADAEADEIDFKIVGTIKMPFIREIKNIPVSEQIYSDNVQKADVIADFMKDLDEIRKKNPLNLRKIRTRAELFHALKNELIYYDNGEVKGMRPTTIYSLSDLFAVADVPLGRPVLDVMQHFHLLNDLPDSNDDLQFNTPIYNDTVLIRDFADYLKLMKEETNIARTGDDPASEAPLQYWTWLQGLYNRVLRPWQEQYNENKWTAKKDTEYFRNEIPSLIEPSAGAGGGAEESKESTADGYIRAVRTEPFDGKKAKYVSTSITRIRMSTNRALGPIDRTDDRKKNYRLREGESAPVSNFILFPLSLTPYLGNPRSGLIARDMEYGQRAFKTLKELIALKGGVALEGAHSDSIIALNAGTKSYQNTALADYLDGLQFAGFGPGSFDFIMRQFGIQNFEFSAAPSQTKDQTPPTYPIILKKMAQTQNALLDYINRLREQLEEGAAAKKSTINDRLIGPPLEEGDETETNVIMAARDAPILAAVIERLKEMTPHLGSNDIAQVAALLKAYPDFFLAVLGNVPAIMAREELHAKRLQFADALENDSKMHLHQRSKGEPPIPNPCKHVQILREIARIRDDNERMQKMVDLVTNKEYAGKRDGNWIECTKCNKHLLCLHDMLQIKMFVRPRERDPILKELYLTFNGPLVSGHYQCRNCGQPIAEIEFDKNLEFDDEGKPMMGRAVLVDRDAQRQQEFEEALDPTIKDENLNLAFKDPRQADIYSICKLIAEKVGIFPSQESYIRIVENVQRHMAKEDSRATYARKVDREKTRDPLRAARILGYDAFMGRTLIASCAANVLIDIQTAIPIYRPRYFLAGCSPAGFGGYPLGGSIENLQGINYLACAVASIRKGGSSTSILGITEPTKLTAWELTEWSRSKSDKERIQLIANKILQIVSNHILIDPTVQHQLKIKNQYLRDTYGANRDTGDFAKDQVPSKFLPRQIVMTAEEQAAKPVVAESVRDPRQAADLYITTAHKAARETAKLYKGSPFSETVCCPAPISDPQLFWTSQDGMPQLQPRSLIGGRPGSRMTVHFMPRPVPSLLVNAKPSLYYRLFLQLCASGPRKGFSHEFGFSHKCANCSLELPSSLLLVKDYIEKTGLSKGDAEKEKRIRTAQLATAEQEANALFEAQGIEINQETFTALLDSTHNAFTAEPYKPPVPQNIYDRIASLAILQSPSTPDWEATLQKIISDVKRYDGMETAKESFIEIFGALSNELDEAAKFVQRQLTTKVKAETLRLFMDRMYVSDDADFNLQDFLEVLLTYFILPMQRISNNVSISSNAFIQASHRLSELDVGKLVKNVLTPGELLRQPPLDQYQDEANEFAIAKLQMFIYEMSNIIYEFKRVNSRNIPGGNFAIMYMAEYLFFKSLAAFLNPNFVPAEIEQAAQNRAYVQIAGTLAATTVGRIMSRYREEFISLSSEQIKTALRAAAETETEQIITRISGFSTSRKEVEMLHKTLRIGRYAVGGSEAIYKYNEDQQARESTERMASGREDFKGIDGEEFAMLYGGTFEAVMEGEGFGGEDGYDNMQYGDDDF